MYETNDKMVSHPSHYMGKNGMEAIDVIEAFTSELEGIEAVDTANVIKYILRWKQKNGLQDLEKAMWYLDHLISHVKMEEIKDEIDELDFSNDCDPTRKKCKVNYRTGHNTSRHNGK